MAGALRYVEAPFTLTYVLLFSVVDIFSSILIIFEEVVMVSFDGTSKN
jgi:hypothetical protein